MIPCTARPSPPPELIEAPPEIERLFRAWFDAPLGRRSGPLHDLATALWKHRGTWLDVGDQIIWLRKNDTIGMATKRPPLTQPEETEK